MKKVLALFLALILLVGITGCLKEGEEELRLIGVLQPNLAAAWQLELKEDIEKAVRQYDDVKCLFADAGNSVEKQISDIENMIKRKVDVIIVFACDEQQISEALKSAVQNGIYVIMLGYAPYDSDAYTVQLLINNYKVGYAAGEYACKVLKGKGTILEVQEDPSQRATQERKKGFLAALEQYPQIVKEYVIAGYGTKDTASQALATSEILNEDTQIDLVFSHNNEMAKGVFSVLKVQGIEPVIIGVGCNKDGTEDLHRNGIDASVNYETLGKEAVEYAMKLIDGVACEKSVEFDPVLYVENDDV